nr:MAG TPA_asm: hypothetical protein [Caudoviricetes sp.]
MAVLRINGVAVKPPKSFEVGIQDIDGETGRNANGEMVRDRITVKRKLSCEWGAMTQEEMAQLLNSVSSLFFEVSYPDPINGPSTGTFYVGDRTAPRYTFTDKFKPWSGAKFNLIER